MDVAQSSHEVNNNDLLNLVSEIPGTPMPDISTLLALPTSRKRKRADITAKDTHKNKKKKKKKKKKRKKKQTKEGKRKRKKRKRHDHRITTTPKNRTKIKAKLRTSRAQKRSRPRSMRVSVRGEHLPHVSLGHGGIRSRGRAQTGKKIRLDPGAHRLLRDTYGHRQTVLPNSIPNTNNNNNNNNKSKRGKRDSRAATPVARGPPLIVPPSETELVSSKTSSSRHGKSRPAALSNMCLALETYASQCHESGRNFELTSDSLLKIVHHQSGYKAHHLGQKKNPRDQQDPLRHILSQSTLCGAGTDTSVFRPDTHDRGLRNWPEKWLAPIMYELARLRKSWYDRQSAANASAPPSPSPRPTTHPQDDVFESMRALKNGFPAPRPLW